MSKTIGIVELYQHNEVLAHYCQLLLHSDYQIYVFCNEKLFHQLPKEIQNSRIIWHLNPDEIKRSDFIFAHEQDIKQCTCTIVSTVFSDFKAYKSINLWSKSIYVLHSAYTWMEPLKHIHLRSGHLITDFLRLVKFILGGHGSARQSLIEGAYKIALPNDMILNHVKVNCDPKHQNKLISLPFGAYYNIENHLKKTDTEDSFKLVIPGTVSREVRDYEMVVQALNKLKSLDHPRIKIVLLGNSENRYAQSIINQLRAIENEHLSFEYFQGFIEQELYDNTLEQADYLLLPLKKYTQFYVFRERTCLSKLSGSINDMIRFGKHTIASNYVRIDEQIDATFLSFTNASELAEILQSLSKPSREINHSFKQYTYLKLLEDFKSQIDV